MKKSKIFFVIFLVIFLSITSLLVLANSKDYNYNTNQSTKLMEKMFEAELKGSNVVVNDSEVNEIINKVLTLKNEYGPLKINNFNVEFLKDRIMFVSNVSYKGITLQLSSIGSLQKKDNYIYYIPENFKIGKLPIPNAIVFNFINRQEKFKNYVENNQIKIDIDKFIMSIDSLSIQDSQIIISMKKRENIIFKDSNDLKNEQNNVDSNKTINIKESERTIAEKTTKTQTAKDSKTINQSDRKVEEQKRMLLKQLNQQLNTTVSKLSYDNQRNVVYTIQRVVNKMISNPNYNYDKDISVVKAEYHKLTEEQKNELKIKLLINTSPSLRNELLSLFKK